MIDDLTAFNKLLAIFISLLLLLNAYVCKSIFRGWLFPASLFSLFWFLMTFMPLVVPFNVPINPLSILSIVLYAFVFSLPCVFFDWKKAVAINSLKQQSKYLTYNACFFTYLYILFYLTFIIATIYNLHVQGFSMLSYLSHPLKYSRMYVLMRYDQEITQTVSYSIALLSNYLLAIMGGLIYTSVRKGFRSVLFVLATWLPGFLFVIFYGSKGMIFLSIAYFYASFSLVRISKGDFSLFDGLKVKTIFLIFILFICFIGLLFVLRGGADIKIPVYSYVFNHIYAYSDWFSHYFFSNSTQRYNDLSSHGYLTFKGLYRFMGIHHKIPLGLYGEYFHYKNILSGNIYTIFRGLISDFGYIGSIFFIFIFSLMLHAAFYHLLCSKRPCVSSIIFITGVGCIYSSFMCSGFVWSITYIVFLSGALLIYLSRIFSARPSGNVRNINVSFYKVGEN